MKVKNKCNTKSSGSRIPIMTRFLLSLPYSIVFCASTRLDDDFCKQVPLGDVFYLFVPRKVENSMSKFATQKHITHMTDNTNTTF